MADNIRIGIEVSDNNTTAGLTQRVNRLRDLLTETATIASNINVGSGTSAPAAPGTGGTTRSRAAAATAAPSGGGGGSGSGGGGGGTAGSRAASTGGSYDQARGTIGTGAEGRDFARQAEGLGGLVRLYATIAANVFAASAAFRALSSAMDTENMVKGLDQLGASSGMALGSLAKDLARTSDGAISLRDAMDAVAKGSAAGLSGTQILRMGDAAKKASQALGLSMPDAISRLSRGIAKIEPELLDELGIYVKIDEATRKYALSLGKPISALTDFEKRQGFANAVLDQAEKKFNNINIDANPYAKLSAALQNLTQTGLTLVNTVAGPLMKMLSENPIALLAVVGLIAKTLISQAIPAIGQYRQALHQQNDAALENIKVLENQRKAIRGVIDEEKAMEVAAKNKTAFDKTQAATATAAALSGPKETMKVLARVTNRTGPAGEIADIEALTAKKLEVEKRLAIATKQANSGALARRDANLALAASLEKVAAAMKEEIATAQKAHEVEAPVAPKGMLGKVIGYFGKSAADKRGLDAANVKAARTGVLEKVSQTYDAAGIRAGFSSLVTGISQARDGLKEVDGVLKPVGAKMGLFQAGMTGAKGVGVLLAGVMGTLTSALSGVGAVAAVVGTGIAIMNTLFSTNAKEAAAANEALDRLAAASKTVDDMFTNLSNTDPLAKFSTEAITARSVALTELSSTLGIAVTKVQEQIAAMSPWDTFLDNGRKAIQTIPLVRKMFDKDAIGKQAEAVSTAVAQALRVAGEGIVSTNSEDAIKRITGVSGRDVEALNEIFAKSPELIKPVQAEIRKLTTELTAVAGRAQAMDEAFKAASKTLDTILVAAIPTEPLAKLGSDMMKLGESISAAMQDPITALEQLQKIAGDTSKLRFLDPAVAQDFIKTSASIKNTAKEVAGITAAIEELKKQEALQEAKSREKNRNGDPTADAKSAEVALKGIQETIKAERVNAAQLAAHQQVNITKLQDQGLAVMLKGAEYIKTAIGLGTEKAVLSFNAMIPGMLGGGKESIIAAAEIQKQEIDLQTRGLRVTLSLIDSQEKLRLAVEAQTNQDLITNLSYGKTDLTGDALRQAKANAQAMRKALEDAMQGAAPTLQQISDKLAAAQPGKLGSTTVPSQGASGTTYERTASGGYKRAVVMDNLASDPNAQNRATRAAAIVAGGQQSAAIASLATTEAINADAIKKKGIDLKVNADLIANDTKELNKQIDREQNLADLARQKIDLGLANKGFLTDAEQSSKAEYENTKLRNDQLKEGNSLIAERKIVESVLDNKLTSPKMREQAENRLLSLEKEREKLSSKFTAQTTTQVEKLEKDRIDNIAKRNAFETETANRRLSEATELSTVNKQILEDQLGLDSQKLEFENSIGMLTEKEYNARKLVVEQAKIERDVIKEIADLESSSQQKINSLRNQLNKDKITPEETKSLKDQIAFEEEINKKRIDRVKTNEVLLKQQADLSFSQIYKDEADRAKLSKDISEVISDALFNGGKDGSKKIRKLIQDELTKPFKVSIIAALKKSLIDPLINSFKGVGSGIADSIGGILTGKTSITDAISGLGDTAMKISSSFSTGLSNSFNDFATSGLGQKFGLSTPGSNASDVGPVVPKGELTSLGANVGTAVNALGGAFAAKGVSDMVTGLLGNYKIGGTTGKLLDVATMVGGVFLGPLAGVIGGVLNGLFGRKLKDVGIQGTFGGANAGTAGFTGKSYQYYKGGMFASNKTKRQDLGADVTTPLGAAFKGMQAQTAFFADALGQNTDKIENFTKAIKFSTKGLTQEQIVQKLQDELTKVGDEMAATVLAGTNYNKMGEAQSKTLERLGTALITVNQVFKNLGLTILTANLSSADLASTITELVGGLDAFNSLSSKYYDSFYTDAEKTANVTRKVNESFAALGIQVPKTREEFRAIISALDQSSPTYAATFAALLQISDSFAQIIPAAETLAEATQRLTDARNAEVDALTSTIDKIKGSIQALKDYKESLLGGEMSVLTPAQKYDQAKSIALETARVAQGTATTPEQIAARDAALSKLPSSTDAWLSASRTLFASSDKYTQDFTQVLGILDATSSALSTQQTDAEKQLAQLISSTSFLGSIAASSQSTADILQQWFSTPEAKAAFAAANPQTQIGATVPQVNNQLVQTISTLETQIITLNDQVRQLRAEQQAQTTQVVIATYDANNRNADEVTAKYEELWNANNWSQRAAVAIV